MKDLKERFYAWYNRNWQAGWYASWALIGGWVTVLIAWLPDLVNWAIGHADFFGQFILPTMDPETKALFVSFYVAFIAPPLRAKLQGWMQRKSIAQQAEAGKVVPLPASGVPTAIPAEVAALIAADESQAVPSIEDVQRQKADPGPL